MCETNETVALCQRLHDRQLQVKKEVELEQAQRVTTERKVAVHDELLRKAAVKQVIFTA